MKTQETSKEVAAGTVYISIFLEKTKAETWYPLQLCEGALLCQRPDDELAQRGSSSARALTRVAPDRNPALCGHPSCLKPQCHPQKARRGVQGETRAKGNISNKKYEGIDSGGNN